MENEEKVMSLLGPFRVLDLTDEKGLMCGRVLGDLGADVIKIEKPGGDPARRIGPFYHDIPDPEKSLHWFSLNMNKRSITLNIETTDGQDIFKRLVKKADFVLESFPPGYMERLGLGYPVLSEINPRIIVTSITHFGQTGPYADYKGSDIVSMAMSGLMYLVGDSDRPPVRISSPQAYFHAGVEGAVGSMVAHYYREMMGEGQHVDVSIQQSIIIVTDNIQMYWDMNKVHVHRAGPGFDRPLGGIFQPGVRKCKDGYVCFLLMGGPIGAGTTRGLLGWMNEEGMLPDFLKEVDWEKFDWAAIDEKTQEMLAQMPKAIEDFLMTHTKLEILEEGVRRRIIIYPINTTEDIRENPQLKTREFWKEVEHPELNESLTYPGPFVRTSENPWRGMRAPLIGEHNEEVYEKELGFAKEDVLLLKQAGII